MDFLFDLPAASAVLPVAHQPIDANQNPSLYGPDIPNPPQPTKLIDANQNPTMLGPDIPNPPPPSK